MLNMFYPEALFLDSFVKYFLGNVENRLFLSKELISLEEF